MPGKHTLFAILALPIAVFLAAASPPVLTKQALALARRSIAASGGLYQMVRTRAFMIAAHDGATPAARARLLAARKAIANHRAELEALNAQYAANTARDISVADLTVLVRFAESPAGRSVQRKMAAIFDGMPPPGGKVPQPSLTPAEWDALAAFEHTPAAQDLKVTNPSDDLAVAAPLLKIIERDTDAICHETKTCGTRQ
jgi:hypothetical protein